MAILATASPWLSPARSAWISCSTWPSPATVGSPASTPVTSRPPTRPAVATSPAGPPPRSAIRTTWSITSGGGYPLDATFYQTVKGICGALPALAADSTLLIASECSEQLGSQAYTDLMVWYRNDWRCFLADIASSGETRLDQWEFQMQARVLERIGLDRLLLVSDGIPADLQSCLAATPILGPGSARQRLRRTVDELLARNPRARVAVIPDGPYTMLQPAH